MSPPLPVPPAANNRNPRQSVDVPYIKQPSNRFFWLVISQYSFSLSNIPDSLPVSILKESYHLVI